MKKVTKTIYRMKVKISYLMFDLFVCVCVGGGGGGHFQNP